MRPFLDNRVIETASGLGLRQIMKRELFSEIVRYVELKAVWFDNPKGFKIHTLSRKPAEDNFRLGRLDKDED